MPAHDHDENKPDDREPGKIDASAGYEKSDVGTRGILVFLTALGIFVVVTAVLCYGIGIVLNAHMRKEDGPRNKWAKTVDVTTLGNLASSPELQNKMATMTQQFPTPRLQTDDGSQEIADLHAKEDLLLENYSWVDESQGKVRIPIERAMELIAQRGLPVAPTVVAAPLLTGDVKPVVAVPLTNGFARTGYEQDLAQAEKIAGKRGEQQ
ncbi:MAG: hypothetical protein ACLQLH_03135 [Terracidiphilus sp.]